MRLAHRGEQVFSFVFGHILWIVGEHCLGSSFARRLQHVESDTGYDPRRRAPDGALDGVSQTAVHVYHDYASGVRDDRPGLESCVRALQTGDVLVIWKLDRLGRNLAHLVNTVQDLSNRGVGLRVLTGQGAQIRRTSSSALLASKTLRTGGVRS